MDPFVLTTDGPKNVLYKTYLQGILLSEFLQKMTAAALNFNLFRFFFQPNKSCHNNKVVR